MVGCIYNDPRGTDYEFGVGLAHEGWSEGLLAYMDSNASEN